jgi:type II secretory pathway component PulF
MTVFRYTALNQAGKQISGEMEARSREDCRSSTTAGQIAHGGGRLWARVDRGVPTV